MAVWRTYVSHNITLGGRLWLRSAGLWDLEVGGKPTKSVQAYMSAMNGLKTGTEAEIVIERGGKKTTIKVTPQ